MRYLIRHRTIYRYARPVELQPHRLMLFPRSSHVIRVLDSSLRCTPAARLERTQDIFDNLIVTADFTDPADQLVIESEVTVEQSVAKWPLFRIATHAHSYPFAYSPDELADLGRCSRRSIPIRAATWLSGPGASFTRRRPTHFRCFRTSTWAS